MATEPGGLFQDQIRLYRSMPWIEATSPFQAFPVETHHFFTTMSSM